MIRIESPGGDVTGTDTQTLTNKTYDFGDLVFESGVLSGAGSRVNLRAKTINDSAVMWMMPFGDPNTTLGNAGFKAFGDDFETDNVNYRDGNIIYFRTGGLQGSGRFRITAKNNGQFKGSVQDLEFTLRDESVKLMRLMSVQPATADSYDGSGNNIFNFNDKPLWKTATSVTTGDYIINEWKYYIARSTGTTGATIPSHTSGTVSDGGVNWEFLVDYTGVAFDPIVQIGNYTSDSTLRTDLIVGATGYCLHLMTSQLVYNAKEICFADNAKGLGARIIANTGAARELFIQADRSYGTTNRLRLSATFLQLNEITLAYDSVAKTDQATTQDVTSTNKVTCNDTVATNFTQFTNGVSHQPLVVYFNTANTTLVHSSNLRVGGVDVTPAAQTARAFTCNSAGVFTMIQ